MEIDFYTFNFNQIECFENTLHGKFKVKLQYKIPIFIVAFDFFLVLNSINIIIGNIRECHNETNCFV